MNSSSDRHLGLFSLAALLISAHYGLGFVLGTAEKALTLGAAGSLYPLCIALGTFALLGLAQFYWQQVDQIWTVLGDRYGSFVKTLIALMSWLSLIGIDAVQIIAGAFILKVLSLPILPSMVGLALIFLLISLLPIEKAGVVFKALLVFNIGSLIYALLTLHGLPEYAAIPSQFLPSLTQVGWGQVVGVSLSTVSLVMIDMKYQQYIVQAKTIPTLYGGSLLAALGFMVLAFLPTALVLAAQRSDLLPMEVTGKEVIPYILVTIGGGKDHLLGFLFLLSLVVPALGIGSSILRIQTKTILDLGWFPVSPLSRWLIALFNASLALTIALKGGEIVTLIASFYAAYVSAIWIPFIAYLLTHFQVYSFSKLSVQLSLGIGSLSAMVILIITLFFPQIALWDSAELTILVMGAGFAILGLFFGEAIALWIPAPEVEEEL